VQNPLFVNLGAVRRDCQLSVGRGCRRATPLETATGLATTLAPPGSRIQTGGPGVAPVLWVLWLCALVLLLPGCKSPHPTPVTEADAARSSDSTLREGDVLKIVFAGTPTLNTTQQIRRDGKINLPLVGDVQAAGFAARELEKQILDAYGSQLLSKEVTVSLESAAIPIFVTGMVLRPGKVMADRPMTLLEAIMEAGGFDYSRANLKAIRVMRREGDRMRTFILNLKPVLDGAPAAPFYLRPADMVYVPERFTLF
jgi:polysaccharide biosynthesis/export protein